MKKVTLTKAVYDSIIAFMTAMNVNTLTFKGVTYNYDNNHLTTKASARALDYQTTSFGPSLTIWEQALACYRICKHIEDADYIDTMTIKRANDFLTQSTKAVNIEAIKEWLKSHDLKSQVVNYAKVEAYQNKVLTSSNVTASGAALNSFFATFNPAWIETHTNGAEDIEYIIG